MTAEYIIKKEHVVIEDDVHAILDLQRGTKKKTVFLACSNKLVTHITSHLTWLITANTI